MAGSWTSMGISGSGSGGKGQTLLEVTTRRRVALDSFFQFVTRMKRHDVAGLDRDRFAGARVAAGSRRLAPDVEVAEARELHFAAAGEALMNDVEEGLDHVLGLALVQAELVEQQFRQLGLG